MRIFFIPLFLLSFLFPDSLCAQVMIDVNSREVTSMVVYGSSDLAKTLTYDKIKGDPFWNNDWQLATLIDQDNKTIDKAKVRLNLYTNEIHFINKAGREMVVSPGLVRKVVFHKGEDVTQVLAVFENDLDQIVENNATAENPSYVQILNFGDIQLLKHMRKKISSADSLFGTMKRYFFSDQVTYYVNDKFGKLIRLNKLTRDNLMETNPAFNQHTNWISANKLNFRREEDVVRFLDFYNAVVKEKGLKK